MLATSVIMFREVLESALIIAIVLSASRGIAGRGYWVTAGIALGLLSSVIVALLANIASMEFSGDGQAILDAMILLGAVVMLTWHNVWMSSHGRQIASEIRAVGTSVQSGHRPLLALLMVTYAAVLREGSEAVLFLWAVASSGEQSLDMLMGGFGGVIVGILVGALLYFGMLRIPMRYFFAITSWLIILIASGLAAQAAGFLNQVGWLPALGNSVWNTAHVLSQSSLLGQLLHILVGYIARPSGIQVVFYAVTFLSMFSLMRIYGGKHAVPAKAAVAA